MKIFCPPESAETFKGLVSGGVTVVACPKLDDAVFQTWRELAPAPSEGMRS